METELVIDRSINTHTLNIKKAEWPFLYSVHAWITKFFIIVGCDKIKVMSELISPESIVPQLGIGEGMRIADFGCGSGHMTMELAKRVGKDGLISAIDVQTSALETVREKAQSLGLKNVSCIHADLEAVGGTDIDGETQDVIFISQALFQSRSKEAIITEGLRILKPMGMLVMIEWKKGSGGLGPPDELRTSEEDLKKLTEAVGFHFERNIEADRFHSGMIFRK